jgi:methionyl-tRNA formyltransferase
LAPDVCVVVAFGQILPAGFFDIPPLGTLNVHASILPAYRGAAPVIHAVLHGEKESGVTIMKIDEGMDTGEILSFEKVPIPLDMTAGELESILAPLGAELLVRTLIGYASNDIKPVEQDNDRATYAPRIQKDMGRIDWERRSLDLHNQIRAFNPRPGAFATFRNMQVKIWRSRFIEGPSGEHHPGAIVRLEENEILVQCGGNSTLSLLEFQMPNRKKVSARDFINGNRVTDSDLFE